MQSELKTQLVVVVGKEVLLPGSLMWLLAVCRPRFYYVGLSKEPHYMVAGFLQDK